MPSSVEDIANQALSYLGVATEIANLSTDQSKEAAACRRFYEPTRDEVFRDFAWPFARKVANLALVAAPPDVDFNGNSEWNYSYRYPADAIMIRRIVNGISRIESTRTRIPYLIGQDDTGQLIYTDQVNAQVVYTKLLTDTSRYPPDVVDTIALFLAAKIGPRVTGGDQFKLSDRAAKMYEWRRSTAQANALNEMEPDREGESDFILSRTGFAPRHRPGS
jgi:hypothetical protein